MPRAPESIQNEVPAPSRLLLIDDEESVLSLVGTLLRRAKYQVETCGNATEAFAALTKSEFDCIITDAIMPSMNGYEFVQSLRNNPRYRDLPVLMLTRKRHRQDFKKALEAGVTDYVLKPIDEELLLEKLELCLKKRECRKQSSERAREPSRSSSRLAQAEIGIECSITALSESELTLQSPVEITSQLTPRIDTLLFDAIGIAKPELSFIGCTHGSGYEARFTLTGLSEADCKKLRAWIKNQETQRKK